MSNLQNILTEITNLTYKIETEYPELYKYLEEDPLTIPNMAHPDTDKKAMQAYLDDLKQMLKQYSKTHKTGKGGN
jgi:hypothetical protein